MVRPMAKSPPNRVRYGSPSTSRSAPRSIASSTMAAPTSRAWSRTGSSADLRLLGDGPRRCRARAGPPRSGRRCRRRAAASSRSRRHGRRSARAFVRRASSATRRTIRASLGPPLRATTARRNAGGGYLTWTAVTIPPPRRGRAGGAVGRRCTLGVRAARASAGTGSVAVRRRPPGGSRLGRRVPPRRASGSSRRYGTFTTTVCGRPSRTVRSRLAAWL